MSEVARGGGRRLQLLRRAVFGFSVWPGVGVLGLLLLQPHVCVQTSLQQQLLVSLTERQRLSTGENTSRSALVKDTYRPRSAIRPSLMTRIWSAPMMVDNLELRRKKKRFLVNKNNQNVSFLGGKERKYSVLPVSNNNCSASSADFSQGRLDVALRLRVQSRCSLKRHFVVQLQINKANTIWMVLKLCTITAHWPLSL